MIIQSRSTKELKIDQSLKASVKIDNPTGRNMGSATNNNVKTNPALIQFIH